MRLLTTIFFGFLIAVSAGAQHFSNKQSFTVIEKLGCAPFTVQITQLIDASFTAQYFYEGNTSTASKTHIYNQPGTYTIQAIYNGQIPNSTDNTDAITIIVTQNIKPAFEMSSCTNGQVQVKVLDTNYEEYIVDFDNNGTADRTITAGGTQTTTFQYIALGPQTISIQGHNLNGAYNCNKEVKNFTAIAALPATTISTLTVADGTSVKLDYTPASNVQYKAMVATNSGTAFQQFQVFNSPVNTPQSITLNGLTTDDKYYCFRVNAYDPCNNTSVISNTICSADFDLNIVSDNNQLTWTTFSTGIPDFTVKRDQANYQNVTAGPFNDASPNITCNTNYCYSIISNYANGSSSISLEKCGLSFTTSVPKEIENVSAVTGEASVDLSWVQDPAFTASEYSINRSVGTGAFSLIGTSLTTDYTDAAYTPTGSFCYRINYTDACANNSPDGVVSCPIRLSGTIDSQNGILLNWSAYTGWKLGVKRYRVEKYDALGALLSSTNTNSLTLIDNANDPDNQVVDYVVTAEPKDITLTESISNRITLTRNARLLFPTAFTPNRDGTNDKFPFKEGQFDGKMPFVENMTLQIFDRWGTLLFSTETNEPWDGTHNGKLMPESSYIWKATITDQTGKRITEIGSVALLHVKK
jgi:gliding motility-associated-like protein